MLTELVISFKCGRENEEFFKFKFAAQHGFNTPKCGWHDCLIVKTMRRSKSKPRTSTGIPSPVTSEDSGLCSLGLEGIHPLSSSPIEDDQARTLTRATMSLYHPHIEDSLTSSLIVKCSPSSICSSLRKRVNEDDYESSGSRDTWNEEMVPMVKTPKLTDDSLSLVSVRDGTFTGGSNSLLNGRWYGPI